MLRDADGGEGVHFSGKKRYEGVRFNVISVTRGWGSNFQKKTRCVTTILRVVTCAIHIGEPLVPWVFVSTR